MSSVGATARQSASAGAGALRGGVVLAALCSATAAAARSFTLGNGTFLKDGAPFQLLSGSMHYFRHHPSQFAARMQLAKQCGLNAVQTYIHWQIHEPSPGVYDRLPELTAYLEAAQAAGLLVVLRAGWVLAWGGGGGGWCCVRSVSPTSRLCRASPLPVAGT
jgi:hypothetical protein